MEPTLNKPFQALEDCPHSQQLPIIDPYHTLATGPGALHVWLKVLKSMGSENPVLIYSRGNQGLEQLIDLPKGSTQNEA